MPKSLQAALCTQLEDAPDRRTITFYNDQDEFSWYSREQFYTQAAGYAEQLAEYGLRKGDVCVLVLPSEAFCATLLTATLMVGAIPLLVAPPILQGPNSNLSQILTHVIDKTSPRIVVCAESMVSVREEFDQSKDTRFLFGRRDLSPASGSIVFAFPDETDVAAMQLTSGTTGFPRICVWKQANVLAALEGMAAAMKLRSDDICLNWTPLYHDMGLVNNFFLCLTGGIPLVMLDPHSFVKTPALWLRGLSNTGATITWSPNFGFALAAQRVRDTEIEGARLDHVRGFWNAAERIHLDTMEAFHERFAPIGVRLDALKTNFGCAENVGGATFSDPDGRFIYEHIDPVTLQKDRIAQPIGDSGEADPGLTVVGVGRPHPHMRVEILDQDGRPLPDGHVGEIALDTPSRMVGYLDEPDATRQAFHGDLLRTGDLGYVRDGEVFWVGRVRERITVRGKKLDPSDFEPILLNVSGLRKGCFVAFGVDDERQGTQRIVIATEVRPSTTRTPAEITGDIRNQVLRRLGVSISEVLLVEPGTLTKTSSGKRRHRHFRQRYLDGTLQTSLWRPVVRQT